MACQRLGALRPIFSDLTPRAYEEIGGVSGSLAHHAEATLEQVGRDRGPVVGELFRGWSPWRGASVTFFGSFVFVLHGLGH